MLGQETTTVVASCGTQLPLFNNSLAVRENKTNKKIEHGK